MSTNISVSTSGGGGGGIYGGTGCYISTSTAANNGNYIITSGSTTSTPGNVIIDGDLIISGSIIRKPSTKIPDYTREWAIRTMAKLTKAEMEIEDLKQYITLLECKLDGNS